MIVKPMQLTVLSTKGTWLCFNEKLSFSMMKIHEMLKMDVFCEIESQKVPKQSHSLKCLH
jgi:hypothetical protein